MVEVIAFPDAEGLVISYLKSAITNLSISTMVPNPRPTRLVKVTRVGGTKIRLNADSPVLVFECWDSDSVKAYGLCRLVRAHVHAMEGQMVNGEWIYRVTEVGGPAFNPDPNTTLPRYQFTVSIDLKGTTL